MHFYNKMHKQQGIKTPFQDFHYLKNDKKNAQVQVFVPSPYFLGCLILNTSLEERILAKLHFWPEHIFI